MDYLFIRRMTMSLHVPHSFELTVRSFLQSAVHAGSFEVKLSRYGLLKISFVLVQFPQHTNCVFPSQTFLMCIIASALYFHACTADGS